MKTEKISLTLLMAVGFMMMLLLVCPEAKAGAKTKTVTITVKKIDQKTAKRVHNQLMKGKAFKLRFKCNEKTFYKKFQKLTKKVAKQTDVGFDLFPICANHTIYFGVSGSGNPKKTGKYTTFVVTKPDCQEYIYGIKFAEQKLRDFTQRVDEIISEMENTHNALMIGTAEPQEGKSGLDGLILRTDKTITNLKELSKYIHATKFRNLSEAMKARILLEVGYIYNRPWGKQSMKYKEESGHLDTFKSLYQKKAYGIGSAFTKVSCKICATFGIGTAEYLNGHLYGGRHSVARVKVKNRGDKIRYVIVDGGVFESYNKFAGYVNLNLPGVYCKRKHKVGQPIKKINMDTQQLKPIGLKGRTDEACYVSTWDNITTYSFDLPKSEW